MSLLKVLRIVGVLIAMAVAVPLARPSDQREPLTRKELKALNASTKTQVGHEALAAYYRAQAERFEAKHQEHEKDLAEYYKSSSRYPSKYPTMGDHCRNLSSYYKLAAQRATNMAEMHEKLAKEATQ
jgi:hypothetical protein